MAYRFAPGFIASAALLLSVAGTSHAAQVEVLHYWTSGGEARSVAELKKALAAKGVAWKDFAVAGGAGENAATALNGRA
jgi:glucose/mannose transport system substrate-binding protein